MQPDNWAVLPPNTLSIDLTSLPKYTQRRVEWDDPTPWMPLSLQPSHLDTHWLKPYRVDMPTPLNLITPILAKERLLLIGTNDLMEINLEQTMLEAFEALD